MRLSKPWRMRGCEETGRLVSSLLVINTLLASSGCGTNPSGGETPPEIPPASTFAMDFSDFTNDNAHKTAAGLIPTAAQLGVQSNWFWAAGHVVVWNVILTVTLAVPVAAFVESFNHTPTQLADGTWAWEYEFVAGGVPHSASLQAKAVGGDIEWNMFITKEGEFTDVNWFSGVSNLIGTAGTWRLNRDPQNVTPFIDIEWNRDPTTDTADIKYVNVVPDAPENGGFIFFATLVGDDGNDRVYQINDAVEINQINIEWHHLTKDGRVQDPAHFSDEDWHCWDSALADIDCAGPTQ